MSEQNEHAGIAIVGMAGRFPGAADVERFWENLAAGVESVTFFRREELAGRRASIPPSSTIPPTCRPARPSTAPSCSTPGSSATPPARPRSWTPSTGCSSSAPGRPWSTPAATPGATAG